MSDRKVVTRFAPSPTGYLHIGGARTALFNWAFARKHSGRFILRMEDTDRSRSTPESTRRIIEDLRWLGLDWDEGPNPKVPDPYTSQIGPAEHGPYFQSQRLEHYRLYTQKLLEQGRAYMCFKTVEELAVDRSEARRRKETYKYDHTESINLTRQQIARYQSEGRPHAIRFRMPDTDITVHDEVLGDVTVKAPELEDFIIFKSDGYPTFHLANVVDDALMGVTHVLRAQEHLMNTPKHVALVDALGLDRPRYAHMPLIFNADGSKMSKRDKAKAARVGVRNHLQKQGGSLEDLASTIDGLRPKDIEAFMDKKTDDAIIASALAQEVGVSLPEIDVHDFRRSGYLPEVILNYISLLGWSPGNNVERFNLDFLVENFDLGRIGKSNARFDRDKLLAFNTEAVTALSPDAFHDRLVEHNVDFHRGQFTTQLGADRFRLLAACYHERSQTLEDPFANGRFFITDDDKLAYRDEALTKVMHKNNGEGFGVLAELRPLLVACDPWSASELERVIKDYASGRGTGLNKVAQPLRVAVSGSTVSPPIFDTLVILGKRSTLARIDRCIRHATLHTQND